MKSMNRTPSLISDQISKADLSLGAHGEDYIIRNAFTLFGSTIQEDRRNANREGELLLADGRLVEVKSDFTGYPLANGTVVVEVKHPRHKPWYACCKQNSVDLIAWCFYRINKNKTPYSFPYAILIVPFARLVELIDEHHDYRLLKNPYLISLSINAIRRYCGNEASYYSSCYPIEATTLELIADMRNHLQSLLPEGLALGEKPYQILFKDCTYSEEENA